MVTGTVISSVMFNAFTGDVATGLSTCLLKDGTQTATAGIPFAAGLTTPTGQGFNPGASQAIIGYFAKRATVDQSITTNTTLASATNMSFAIAASEEWFADCDIDLNGVTALQTTGMKWAVTVPAGATLNVRVALIPNVVAAGTNILSRNTTTGGAAIDFTAATLPDVTAGGLVRISIWVLNSSTAGTVQVQVAQSTSSATALVIAKGSHLLANRVA